MSLITRLRQMWAGPLPLRPGEWFRVTFDDDRVRLLREPPGREAWSEDFTWDSIERVVFKPEDLDTSDGIYVFTSSRPESYVIPTEAHGGGDLWAEIIRRDLFDPDLAIEAATSVGGVFVWPPISE